MNHPIRRCDSPDILLFACSPPFPPRFSTTDQPLFITGQSTVGTPAYELGVLSLLIFFLPCRRNLCNDREDYGTALPKVL